MDILTKSKCRLGHLMSGVQANCYLKYKKKKENSIKTEKKVLESIDEKKNDD